MPSPGSRLRTDLWDPARYRVKGKSSQVLHPKTLNPLLDMGVSENRGP